MLRESAAMLRHTMPQCHVIHTLCTPYSILHYLEGEILLLLLLLLFFFCCC